MFPNPNPGMPNVKNNAAAQETCRKLIDAAGRVFADKGLHAATLKDITTLAGVNTAAINYHFRDKMELYDAVVRYALGLMPTAFSRAAEDVSPRERLRLFVSDVMDDMYDPARPTWCATLMAHEFAQPTAALTSVIEEVIRPRADYLNRIVRDILGPRATPEQVLRGAMCVAAQCFHYLYHGPVIERLYPQLVGREHKEEMATHIYEFSLSALLAMRRHRHT